MTTLTDTTRHAAGRPIAAAFDFSHLPSFPVLVLWFLIFFLVFLPNRFYVPYVLTVAEWDFSLAEVAVPVCLFLVWLLRGRMFAQGHRQPQPKVVPWLGGWLLAAVLSTALAIGYHQNPARGFSAILSIAVWMSPLLVIPACRFSRKEINQILFFFCFCAVLGGLMVTLQSLATQSIYGLLGWRYVVYETDSERRGVLPLGVSTVIGAYFGMVLPLMFSGMAGFEKKWQRIACGLGIPILSLGCLFTSSRTTLLMLVVVLFLSFIFIRVRRARFLMNSVLIIGTLALLVVFFSRMNFERLGKVKDASTNWRERGLIVSWMIFRDAPVFGAGVESNFQRQGGDFRFVLKSSVLQESIMYNGEVGPYEPHNTYCLVLSETGLVGLSLFLLFLACLFYELWNAQKKSVEIREKMVIRGFLVGFLAVCFHSLAGSDILKLSRISALCWIFLGLSLSYLKYHSPQKAVQPSSSPPHPVSVGVDT